MKPYARVPLEEEELKTLISLVRDGQKRVEDKADGAQSYKEQKFYEARAASYTALLEKLEKPLLNDTSQDAEEDEEDEDAEDVEV
jgi:hypothetical protein